MNSSWFQTDDFKIIRSNVTDRDLIVNCSKQQFLISPLFSKSSLFSVLDAFEERNDRYATPDTSRLSQKNMRFVNALKSSNSVTSFHQNLDVLVGAIKHNKSKNRSRLTGITRIVDLFVGLWEADCIIWPRQPNFFGKRFPLHDLWLPLNESEGKAGAIRAFEKINEASMNNGGTRGTRNIRRRFFLEILFSTGGTREIGDLTPEVVDRRLLDVRDVYKNFGTGVADFIVKLIRAAHPEAATISIPVEKYGPFITHGVRSSVDFNWATKADPSLEQWRELAAAWFLDHGRNISQRRNTLNRLFDRLIAEPQAPRDPMDILRDGSRLPVITGVSQQDEAQHQLHLRSFFDWILDTRCVEEDDRGLPIALPGYRNPINVTLRRGSRTETHREAIPTRYIRILKEIIEENDFEWPRKHSKDYFLWHNPETGEWQRIWSPVRARAMLVKLELPLRTYQVRVLSSGEGDFERYDTALKRWTRNEHPIAARDRKATPKGVLRRYTIRKKTSILSAST